MPITVKYAGAMKYLKGTFDDMQKEFREEVAADLGQEINDKIESGTSPVKGEGRFVEYSDGYKSKIQGGLKREKARKALNLITSVSVLQGSGKRIRPVNLKVTGDLLKSQDVKIDNVKGVKISYRDKKAVWHNDTGAGKGRVLRRMLPNRIGEEFSQTIMKSLKTIAAKAVAKILKR